MTSFHISNRFSNVPVYELRPVIETVLDQNASDKIKQDMQRTYNVTLRRVHETIVVVEKK